MHAGNGLKRKNNVEIHTELIPRHAKIGRGSDQAQIEFASSIPTLPLASNYPAVATPPPPCSHITPTSEPTKVRRLVSNNAGKYPDRQPKPVHFFATKSRAAKKPTASG